MKLLKISFLLFFIIPIAIIANNGYSSIDYLDMNSYKEELKEPEFDSLFETELDKNDFKKLREFFNKKRDIEVDISIEIEDLSYTNSTNGIDGYSNIISKLDKKYKESKKDSIELNIQEYEKYFFDREYDYLNYNDDIRGKKKIKLPRSRIKDIIALLEERIVKYEKIEEEKQQLLANWRNVRSDIYNCESQINSALRPEYEKQKFRKAISGYFAALIGFLLAAFFVVVYFKSTNSLSSLLLSGNGLQFITLFVLIIAIILFGILGILEGRELAAILSGISGYILGKGITPLSTTVPPTTVPLPRSTT